MSQPRSLPLCMLAGALLCSMAAAQTAAPNVRIATPIDESQLVTLKGDVNPAAIAKNDRGPVSPSLALPDLTLVLSRSPEQQAAFDAFVQSQYDPGSPNYHRWLTSQQIGERFGPSEADITTICNWLASQGFTVKNIPPDRMTIRFSGTAGEAEAAFHTEIHNLSVNGVPHFANMTNPQIPAALAPVVVGVKALHNFLPQPQHVLGSLVRFNPKLGGWQRIASSTSASSPGIGVRLPIGGPAAAGKPALNFTRTRPEFGINVGSGTSAYLEEDVTPYDFATIYNVLPLWNAGINGTGETIAIAGTSLICAGNSSFPSGDSGSACNSANDVATYRSAFGLPAYTSSNAPKQIDTGAGPAATVCTSTSSTAVCGIGDLQENSLDVEVAGAVAPGAQIDLVVTGQNSSGSIDTVYDSAQYVVENDTAKILNVSYGGCELAQGTAGNVAIYDLWQSAASEGISVTVAAGDSGSPDCDDGMDASYGNPYLAQYGLSVSGLASTPYNVAVGGTDFSWCQPYYNSSGNFEGCPDSSTSQGSPAYWNTSNNTSSEAGESAAGYVPETPWNDTCMNPINARYLDTLLSASGEDSNYSVNPTTPEETCAILYKYWSYFDSDFENSGNSDPYFELYVDTVGGSGGTSNCVVSSGGSSTTFGTCTSGSTSTGAANGSIPLTDDGWPSPAWQYQSGVTGTSNLTQRAVPDVSFFAGNGNLGSATLICVSLAGSCVTSVPSDETTEPTAQEIGGTSVGTPEMAGVMALVNQKAGSAQGNPNPVLYKLASEENYSNCSAETVKNSSNCYFQDIDSGPTAASGSPAYPTAQTNSMPCDLNNSPEGGDNSSTGAGSAGTTSPNCTALNSGDATIGVGTLVTTQGGSTPAYNSATGYDLATGLGSLNVANVVNAPGNVWVGSGTPVTGNATATVTVTPALTSISSNQSLSVVVTVSGSSGTPTGTVTLSGGGYSSGAETLSSGSYTFTISADTFTSGGSVTLTANYSGDSTYAAASGTAAVTVTYVSAGTYSLSATTPAAVYPGGTAISTITGNKSSTGYSGTVTLSSCTLTSEPSNYSTSAPVSCSVSGTITYTSGTPSGSATATVTTTATTVGALTYPKAGHGKGWLGAGGGAMLAFLVFLGIPSRRRYWRSLLGLVVLMAALGGLSACGSGGGGSSTGNNIPGTAAGPYTFTVTSSGTPPVTPAPTVQFSLTVN